MPSVSKPAAPRFLGASVKLTQQANGDFILDKLSVFQNLRYRGFYSAARKDELYLTIESGEKRVGFGLTSPTVEALSERLTQGESLTESEIYGTLAETLEKAGSLPACISYFSESQPSLIAMRDRLAGLGNMMLRACESAAAILRNDQIMNAFKVETHEQEAYKPKELQSWAERKNLKLGLMAGKYLEIAPAART